MSDWRENQGNNETRALIIEDMLYSPNISQTTVFVGVFNSSIVRKTKVVPLVLSVPRESTLATAGFSRKRADPGNEVIEKDVF